jgi:DNA-binding MarR family transcriptional regulator
MARRSNDNRLSTNRSVILHFWEQGDLSVAEIARLTKIPIRTVHYNIDKMEKYGNMNHRGGNGRIRKIKHEDSIAIGQWIR